MNEATESARKRVLRSDLALEQQCNVVWLCALCAVFFIQSGTTRLENHALAATLFVVLGIPLIGIGVMKLMHPLGNAVLKRSRKVDFVDDIKNPPSDKERLPALSINGSASSRIREIPRGLGGLLLMLALYIFIVALSFAYQSSIYFFMAVAISVCIVTVATFLYAREKAPGKSEAIDERPAGLQDDDDATSTHDSYISWTVGEKSKTQFRLSRNWVFTHMFFLGIWLPLILAIPLIGPLFSEVVWVAIGVGIAYIAVLELCSMFILVKVGSRVLGAPEG